MTQVAGAAVLRVLALAVAAVSAAAAATPASGERTGTATAGLGSGPAMSGSLQTAQLLAVALNLFGTAAACLSAEQRHRLSVALHLAVG